MNEFDWTKAACQGQQPLFFPPPRKETPRQVASREAKAKVVCMTCSIRAECQAEAEANPEMYVDLVMGGLAYEERVEVPSRRSRAHARVSRNERKERRKHGTIIKD